MKQNRTESEIFKEIREYFEKNTDIFNDCMEELDSWNGYLGDDHYYPMEELDELYAGQSATEILCRAFYGHDEENWTFQNGEKVFGEFNPNRDYFRFNGYGNLVSSDYKDYSDLIDDDAIRAMWDNRVHLDTIDDDADLCALFDELDAQEEDGEEEEDEQEEA